MTTATLKDARFWDNIADSYSRKPIADEEAYEIKLSITREYLSPEDCVLEFGCGTGSTALRHAPYVAHIDAIDVSSEMIAIAQRKADAGNVPNVTFREGDIEDPSLETGRYDAVFGLSILHLMHDRDAVLQRVHTMLKPGGVFVTSTTCLGDGQIHWRMLLPLMRAIGKAPFISFFSQNDLIEAHTRAGFQIVHQWQPSKDAALFLVAQKI
ncbi:class I SAM-dependent methyltransferase [Ponticaulis koreensis]|uniref:class I SAM-dependent methyltransferase n=1 Tax=Ponticaulis koreensis TaxID=1123045 RepID=UPI0003B4D619|nr:class I SAM-dependent methyltransferase [Ponticaulis koreensis]